MIKTDMAKVGDKTLKKLARKAPRLSSYCKGIFILLSC